MYLLGGPLTKALATAAALLTVLAGVPHLRCVCPDGRPRLFCPGLSLSTSCCCASAHVSSTGTVTGTADCCSHSAATPDCSDAASSPSGGDGSFVAKKCGCERKLVSDSGPYSVGGAGETADVEAAVSPWETLPVVSEKTFFSARVSPHLLPPPNRVVQFCHFTC